MRCHRCWSFEIWWKSSRGLGTVRSLHQWLATEPHQASAGGSRLRQTWRTRQRGKKRSTEKQSFLARAQAENLVWGFPRVLSLLRGEANLVSLGLSLEGESVHWIPGPAIQLGQVKSRAPRTRGGYNNKLSGSRVASCRPPLTSSREWRGGYLELSGQARVQASMEETRITEPDGAVGLLWVGAEDPRRTRTQGFSQPEGAKT